MGGASVGGSGLGGSGGQGAGGFPVGGSAGLGGLAGTSGSAAGGAAGLGGLAGGAGQSGSGQGAAGGSAGVSGSAGLGGTAGDGGQGGSGGADLFSIAAELHMFRLECPCIDADHFGSDKTDNCDSSPEVDRQVHMKTLGGDSGVVYNVTLRVRGNTEPNTYVDGTLEQERFYIGGRTSTPGYTAYMLSVSDPQQVYFFNYNPTTGHIHFLLDYEVVIPIRGGAQVTFEVNGGDSVPDGHGVSNREALVVPGIPPAPEPFNGQLVQFDVVSVEAQAP